MGNHFLCTAHKRTYQLIWEVANTINCAARCRYGQRCHQRKLDLYLYARWSRRIALGLQWAGELRSFGAVNDLAPSGGSGAFAYMDVQPPPSSTNVAPIFDTVDGYSASRIYSATFSANAGDMLTLDAAFLTSDGSPYDDYGLVAPQSVPEPSSLVMAVIGTLGVLGCALCQSHNRAGRCWDKHP